VDAAVLYCNSVAPLTDESAWMISVLVHVLLLCSPADCQLRLLADRLQADANIPYNAPAAAAAAAGICCFCAAW
jgi:uncharacterized protein YhhL (DUF1145 family)